MAAFLPICLNPTLQKTLVLDRLVENEVNRSSTYYLDASGKGVNVARVLRHLGEDAIHLTHLGGRNRDLFLDLAQADDVAVQWVDSGSEIRFCHSLLSTEAHTTTEIVEEAESVAPTTESLLLDAFDRLLSAVEVVTISGSKAGGYSAELFPEMVRRAKAAGCLVILDVRGADLVNSLSHRPDVIKPNLAEFAQTFLDRGTVAEIGEQSEDTDLLAAVRGKMLELAKTVGCSVVLTRGAKPVLYCSSDAHQSDTVESVDAPAVEPVNTIGCGDAFTAGLATVLRQAGSLRDAVERGLACAAANAELVRPGVLR